MVKQLLSKIPKTVEVRHAPRSAGFTLIELLVSITIMVLLVGVGAAAFINFNDRQKVLSVGEEVRQQFAVAQTRAQVSQKPSDCASTEALAGWRVKTASTNSPIVQLWAVCGNREVLGSEYELANGVVVVEQLDILFQTLHGGASTSQVVHVAQALDSASPAFIFTVEKSGAVSQGVLGSIAE